MSITSELRKLQVSPLGGHRKIVAVGRRLLIVCWWQDMGTVIRGNVVPLLPWHLDSLSDGFPIQTMCSFKINHVGTEYQNGDVQNISVVDAHQRKGWGSSLVEALLPVFPDVVWHVSGANEKSTALFEHLHRLHPERIEHPRG